MNNLFMERPLRSAAAEGCLRGHVSQRIPEHGGGHPSNVTENGASRVRGPLLAGQAMRADAGYSQNAAVACARIPNQMPNIDCGEFDLDEARGFETRRDQGFVAAPPRTAAADAALDAVPAISRGPVVREEGSGAAPMASGSRGPYSVAQEAYRAELDYDKQRSRKRKLSGILRVLLLVALVPVLLVAIFIASYALTCIINGATPEELVRLMGNLLARVEGFAHDVMQRI